MSESKLKIYIGLFIIISNFSLIIMTIILFTIDGFLFEEMTTTVALIVPMFSIYTTAIVKYIISNKNKPKSKDVMVTKAYVFISFLFPISFVAMLVCSVFMKAYNVGFSSFDQFKITLGILEVAFGAYMGMVLSSMFEVKIRTNKMMTRN